jgi:type 1 glutamine amidotransferase
VIQHPNNPQTPAAGNQSVQMTPAAKDPLQADLRYYNYGEKGHYVNRCPNPHTRANQTTTTTPTPTSGANSIPVAAKQNYARGRVNHVVVEEAQEALDRGYWYVFHQ